MVVVLLVVRLVVVVLLVVLLVVLRVVVVLLVVVVLTIGLLVDTLGTNLLDVCGLPVARDRASLSSASIDLQGVWLQDFLSLFPPRHF